MDRPKHPFSKRILTLALSALLLALTPLHVLADTPDYISEIRIGMGKTAKEAYDALVNEGYTVLTYGDGYTSSTGGDDYKQFADLNEKAGSDMPIFGKGDKVVFLGYKTTKDKNEAVTDLALMNMRGGYSVNDYDVLMEYQINNQIKPLLDKFIAAIQEYRANYASANPGNRARAAFVHDMLDRMVDDDTGMTMGELFLQESKEELGAAYGKLSDAEKKRHGDLTTIFMQSNGRILYTMESLLARAADTNEQSWVARFTSATEDSLLAQFGNMLPADAYKQLDRKYNDLANQLLIGWSDLQIKLLKADKAIEIAEYSLDVNLYEFNQDIVDDTDAANDLMDDIADREVKTNADRAALDEDLDTVVDAMVNNHFLMNLITDDLEIIKFARAAQVLKEIPYQGGTLYDFFTQPYEDVSDDEGIRALYPICAALTEGQKAALDFLPLYELILIGSVGGEEYAALSRQIEDENGAEELKDVSIYDGVNRELYQKETVALTSESLREKAAQAFRNAGEVDKDLSLARQIFMYASAASLAALMGTAAVRFVYTKLQPVLEQYLKLHALLEKSAKIKMLPGKVTASQIEFKYTVSRQWYHTELPEEIPGIENALTYGAAEESRPGEFHAYLDPKVATHSRMTYVMYGLEVAAIVLTAVTVTLTWIELKQYYNVEFTKLPKYMVDEADITAYDDNGNKIVLQNQAAYYTAAETNRGKDAEYYDMLNVYADLNGDVGREWLALYWAKDLNAGKPIIASSLYAQVGKSGLPAGYTKGIHMFGSGGAANLVNDFYCWNDDVNGIYVFYQTDDTVKADDEPGAAGSLFTGGMLATAGGIGLIVGGLVSGFVTASVKKKKYPKAKA